MFTKKKLSIPADFIINNELSWSDKQVLLFILAFKKLNKKNPARVDFDRYSGVAYSTAKKCINKLVETGLLDIKIKRKGDFPEKDESGSSIKRNEYTFNGWKFSE